MQGQRDEEACAAPRFTLDMHGPAMPLDDSMGDGQSEARASPDVAGGEEWLEDLREDVRFDSDAGIGDDHGQALGASLRGERDRPVSLDGLDGVAEEIDEELHERARV